MINEVYLKELEFKCNKIHDEASGTKAAMALQMILLIKEIYRLQEELSIEREAHLKTAIDRAVR